MKFDFKVSGKKSQIVLDGPEGRGKTFTLLLLAHLLRESSKVFLVYFKNSKEINNLGWREICKQFEFALIENEKEKVRNIKRADDVIIKNELNNILEDYQEKGFLTILMIDQLNFLTEEAHSIVSKLFTMSGWDVELCSQSANNEPKNTFIKYSKPIFCPELMNETEIQALIEDYQNKHFSNK